MLEPLTDLPDGVIGFEAVGTIHGADYDTTLRPAIDAATEGGIRLVYILGPRFEGYSSGASWDDLKLGVEHLRSWKRTALVTDVDWVRHLAATFGWMIPGRFRHFTLAERAEAIVWAAADDSTDQS